MGNVSITISNSRLSRIHKIKINSSTRNTTIERRTPSRRAIMKAQQTTDRVAEGVDDGVACVAERGCRRAIAVDDEVSVFKNFPRRLESDGEGELPGWTQP